MPELSDNFSTKVSELDLLFSIVVKVVLKISKLSKYSELLRTSVRARWHREDHTTTKPVAGKDGGEKSQSKN